jgi:hypothetical protein
MAKPTKPKPAAPETIAAVKIGEEMSASQFRAPYQSTTAITGEDAVMFTAPQLIAILAVAAERGWSACMAHLRVTRGRKAHPLCVAPKPCACGACKRISALPEFTRRNPKRERAIRRADRARQP